MHRKAKKKVAWLSIGIREWEGYTNRAAASQTMSIQEVIVVGLLLKTVLARCMH